MPKYVKLIVDCNGSYYQYRHDTQVYDAKIVFWCLVTGLVLLIGSLTAGGVYGQFDQENTRGRKVFQTESE